MPFFTKKPITVEAVQWLGGSFAGPAPKWIVDALLKDGSEAGSMICIGGVLHINTLEGVHEAGSQDWVIKGVKGELYPCKDDIFQMTYELCPEAAQ